MERTGLLLGIEGNTGMRVGYKGRVTKCAPEAFRLATSREQLAAEDWADALADVLKAVKPPAGDRGLRDAADGVPPPWPPPQQPAEGADGPAVVLTPPVALEPAGRREQAKPWRVTPKTARTCWRPGSTGTRGLLQMVSVVSRRINSLKQSQ